MPASRAVSAPRFHDQWVPLADLPYLRMRWVRTAEGAWVHPAVLEEQKEAARLEVGAHRVQRRGGGAERRLWCVPRAELL